MQKHVQPVDEAIADANDSFAHLREQVAVQSPVTLQRLIGNSHLSEIADLDLKKVLKTKTDPKLALFLCGQHTIPLVCLNITLMSKNAVYVVEREKERATE